ncbi:MAG: 4-hydroxythreonine-4-phosphate dehydrogenase PdxA [Caldilineaceae bacterium]
MIAIAMGDPAGIGPELVAKVLAEPSIYALCAPFVIGHPAVLEAAGALVGSALTWRSILALAEARFEAGTVDVLCPAGLEIGEVPVGRVDAAMGKAAALCLETAYALAQAGQVQGVAAAPMNKDAFHRAGYHYYDELAWLAAMTQSPEPFLVGVTSAMWTVTVTEHIPFKEIAEHIRQDRILDRTRKLYNVLVRVGFAEPRIAVAALNPHAGESGLFGREEIDEIAPAVRAAQQDDINAEGPIPADAVFVRTQAGEFDGVVCMYHDQANIARKLQPSRSGTTLFMGLPVVCGTTAHGTAFDIAGQGVADAGSMRDALEYVIRLAGSD